MQRSPPTNAILLLLHNENKSNYRWSWNEQHSTSDRRKTVKMLIVAEVKSCNIQLHFRIQYKQNKTLDSIEIAVVGLFLLATGACWNVAFYLGLWINSGSIRNVIVKLHTTTWCWTAAATRNVYLCKGHQRSLPIPTNTTDHCCVGQ